MTGSTVFVKSWQNGAAVVFWKQGEVDCLFTGNYLQLSQDLFSRGYRLCQRGRYECGAWRTTWERTDENGQERQERGKNSNETH